MTERRRSVRMRSLKGARIVFNPHWPMIDCVVRNISRDGACIEMEGEFNTAPQFDLLFLQEGETRPCRQVWRRGRRVGVAFR